MKKSIVLLLVASAFVAQAYAKEFECEGGMTLSSNGNTISIKGGNFDKKVTGRIVSEYHPRPSHAGSKKYVLEDACNGSGDISAILDKDLLKGKKGELTIENNCDTDGTAPNFSNFTCE